MVREGVEFSVATPTLNALEKLKRCVGSVRAQTNHVVEHLIQDSLSSDGTRSWAEAQPDLNVRSEKDEGMYDAINRAWGRAQGKYLSWLNADEQYLPGALTVVADFFGRHASVDVLFGDYLVTCASGQLVAQRREIGFRSFYVKNGFLNAQSCTLFFRRRLLDRGSLRFDPKYRYAGDKDLLLRLHAEGVRIAHIPVYLALFGVDGTNLSGTRRAADEAEAIRLAHGALRSKSLRIIASLGRRLERFAIGAYVPRDITYRYAIDEVPHYLEVNARRVGGRYSLRDIRGGDIATVSTWEQASPDQRETRR
jgi:glycosyltransferase involved in cell wall biosynthesis